MVERVVRFSAFDKRFVVDVGFANRERKLPFDAKNATDCCAADVKLNKYCGGCGGPAVSSRKRVKLGRESRLIPTALFEQVSEELERREDIVVHHVVDWVVARGAEDRFGRLVVLSPVSKREGQYAELRAVLGERVGVVAAVVNGHEYEGLLYAGDDGVLRLRLLLTDQQMHALPDVGGVDSSAVSSAVVSLERQLLERRCFVSSYDFAAFEDVRSRSLMALLEQALVAGDVPVASPVVARAEAEAEEIRRLQQLLEE